MEILSKFKLLMDPQFFGGFCLDLTILLFFLNLFDSNWEQPHNSVHDDFNSSLTPFLIIFLFYSRFAGLDYIFNLLCNTIPIFKLFQFNFVDIRNLFVIDMANHVPFPLKFNWA